jgi:hypothetical protein
MERSIRIGKLRAGALLFLAAVIVSMATVVYRHALQASKEKLLQNNRFQLRVVVDEFVFDRHKSPKSMRELVEAGYLRSALLNPLTGEELSLLEGVHNALDMY